MSVEDEPTTLDPTNKDPMANSVDGAKPEVESMEPSPWQSSPQPVVESTEGLPVLPPSVEAPANDIPHSEENVFSQELIDDVDFRYIKKLAMELDDVKNASPALKEAIGEAAVTKFKAEQKAKRDEESEKQADIDAKATEIKARLESDEPLDAILPKLKIGESPSEASDSLDYTDASTLGTPSPVSEDGEWVKHEQHQTGSGLLT